jgi:glucose/arabinose dehydrogenase
VRRRRSLFLAFFLAMGAVAFALDSPQVAADGKVAVYLSGLSWPIALAFSPDGRIFFAERFTGAIRIIEDGSLLPTPFYTLTNTSPAGERGLLGLALDPGFPTTPYVYAYQTYDDAANGSIVNRIVRILASGDAGLSHAEILRTPPLSGATNHNGGVIGFGPDGKLYALVGENANTALSQDPLSLLGKVLRMNPDGSVPSDNPFVGNASWDGLVYTSGHRNNFGLAFHPDTGRAYVTENGPGCNDEVNLLAAGRNYGWGPSHTCSSPPPPPNNTNRDGPNPVLPIWWWGPTICPTNAAFLAGPTFPAWRGDLIMGDCNDRRLHRFDLSPPAYETVALDTILYTAPSSIIEVEAGPDGAIWFTTPSTIYRYFDAVEPPTASFTATPNPVDVGVAVAFDASASSDPDGTIVSYAWDFGDFATGTGVTTSHAYTGPGTYTVVLNVTDNGSFTHSTSQQVVVVLPPGPQAPIIEVAAGATIVAVALLLAIRWRSRSRRRRGLSPPPG